ncbi:uncharacterized protein LOC122289345 [Carya illinoinensis]|uniref:uncharacterized protein LOC122289345 n=1 Tax=Carya illinoinensis TaxID=32201 RepID=UPI001C720816|nr:uncharacterized protein LOC122289345 [Carya illinoinensis]
MVINYKKLNEVTAFDGYYIPKKEQLIELIRGNQWFSSLDCKSGFWQIKLKPECSSLTAFSCPQGQYEWNVIPFGPKQAPGDYKRSRLRGWQQWLTTINDKRWTSKSIIALMEQQKVFMELLYDTDPSVLQHRLVCSMLNETRPSLIFDRLFLIDDDFLNTEQGARSGIKFRRLSV